MSLFDFSPPFFYLGDILRGIQCTHSHPFGSFKTPLIYGNYEKSLSQSKERCTSIKLLSGTNTSPVSITSVSIRYGALVDSVTLTLSSGESVTAGGTGGGDVSTIHIPEGSQVVGFYGGERACCSVVPYSIFVGLGGHVHNFGVVISMSPPMQITSFILDPLRMTLLDLASTHELTNCGMLGGTIYGKVFAPIFVFLILLRPLT